VPLDSSLLHTRVNIVLSGLTLAGTVVLLFLAFFGHVSPMKSHRLVALEGLGIGPSAEFVITREFCFDRDNEAIAHRAFRRFEDDDSESEEVYELPPTLVHFLSGCRTASRRVLTPSSLRPGRYLYTASLQWCSDYVRCETVRLPDLGVRIIGEGDRRLIRPYALEK
jgi:hypothetical protein